MEAGLVQFVYPNHECITGMEHPGAGRQLRDFSMGRLVIIRLGVGCRSRRNRVR